MRKLSDTIICNLEQVARLTRVSATRYFEKNKNIELSFNDFLIIDALVDNAEIHQRNLAKYLTKGTANLSRDLERLEKRGLIRREIKTKSHRAAKVIKLTQEGMSLYKKISEESAKHVKKIESIFNEEEYEQFNQYISRMKERLSETMGIILE